jgi:competence ComEA-like helix-hairpin-helix protein
MTNNICGNNASPLRDGGGCGADFPTLRIGLISGVPLARRIHRAITYVIISATLVAISACSSRTEYSSANSIAPLPNAININTATIDELEKLPHIGRKTAEAIVEFRTLNGPFRRVEHLMQIRGVSEERFENLRPLIKIE